MDLLPIIHELMGEIACYGGKHMEIVLPMAIHRRVWETELKPMSKFGSPMRPWCWTETITLNVSGGQVILRSARPPA